MNEYAHTSVLLCECIEALNIKPDGIYVDGTLGGGGHSLEIAKRLSKGEGDRVRHVKFGEGTVLEIRSGGRDYEVTVDFDSAGVRKMFAKFAKLVKIS